VASASALHDNRTKPRENTRPNDKRGRSVWERLTCLQKGEKGGGERRHQAAPSHTLARKASREGSEHRERHEKAATGKEETGERGDRVRARKRKWKRTARAKRASTYVFKRHTQEGLRRASLKTVGDPHKALSRNHGEQGLPAYSSVFVLGARTNQASESGGVQAQDSRSEEGNRKMGRKSSRKQW